MHDYLELWNWDGTLERVHHSSTWRCASKRDGKQARQQQPSIRWAQRVPKRGSWLDPSGYDAARRGRRDGPPVERGRSDRDGAFQLLRRARRLLSFIERIADGGYAGNKMRSSSAHAWRLRIVKRFDAAGFEVLPKRWDRRTNFLRGSAAIAAWLVTLNATPQPS